MFLFRNPLEACRNIISDFHVTFSIATRPSRWITGPDRQDWPRLSGKIVRWPTKFQRHRYQAPLSEIKSDLWQTTMFRVNYGLSLSRTLVWHLNVRGVQNRVSNRSPPGNWDCDSATKSLKLIHKCAWWNVRDINWLVAFELSLRNGFVESDLLFWSEVANWRPLLPPYFPER